ncbi:MAG: ketoacyl-ACP synthase III [Chloroflexi bacterium]|nr:ketoacyl-ACP synthase III [Chloroflexota bacterium]
MEIQGPRVTIAAMASVVPPLRIGNAELAGRFPQLSGPHEIKAMTGVQERRYATPEQTATDLAREAAEHVFDAGILRDTIDFLLFCTETPDYLLPASACVLQHALGLPSHCAAFDINLGCSAWVYALGVAQGLISARLARTGLILTADVISRYLNPRDRSTVLLFGDAATATVVTSSSDGTGLSHLVFGTDGSGGRYLRIPAGGARLPRTSETAVEHTDASGNVRSANDLYMNGAEVLSFTLRQVPRAIQQCLREAGLTPEQVNLWVLHQASRPVLDALQRKFQVPSDRFVRFLDRAGNTVGSALPLAFEQALRERRVHPGNQIVVSGFGVGFSWAAALLQWGGQGTLLGRDPLGEGC